MKRLVRIFELSTNEQRVVLIVTFVVVAMAFVGYERRLHRSPVRRPPATQANPSATPAAMHEDG